jgi:hypothetical protein
VDRKSLYDLKGKKGAFIQTDVDRMGARMKTTIIVGDFIDPVPAMFRSREEQEIPPTCFREYAIFNSHDGSLAARIDPGYKVLRCLNGIRSTQFSSTIKSRHTSGFSVEAFRRQVMAAAHLMENDAARFELYARTRITKDQARTFLKNTLARRTGNFDDEEDSYSKPLLDKIMTRFLNHEADTVWGLYMAMTWYATHDDVRGSSSEMMSRIRRDENVSRAMRSAAIESLLPA